MEAVSTTEQDHHANPKEVRRSFTFLTLDAAFYWIAMAFLDPSTVLPAFLSALGISPLAIGVAASIKPLFQYIPQLWAAHYLRDRVKHKGYLVKNALISRTAVTLFAVVLFVVSPGDRAVMFWSFIGMYTAFWFSEGLVGVSWTDLTAKCIPERLRGRLYGTFQLVSGAVAALAGLVVKRVLSDNGPAFPTNYAILAAIAAVFFATSLTCLSMVREPDGAKEECDGSFPRYVQEVVGMLIDNSQLKRFAAVQILMGAYQIALANYVLYAKQVVHLHDSTIGILLSIQIAGWTVVSAIAGLISDHWGPKQSMLFSIVVGLMAPLFALVAGKSMILYAIVFFALGGISGSCWIGSNAFILEIAKPHERRSIVGLINTAVAPTAVFPIIGGYVATKISFPAVFMMTAVAFAAAFVLTLGLDSREQAC